MCLKRVVRPKVAIIGLGAGKTEMKKASERLLVCLPTLVPLIRMHAASNCKTISCTSSVPQLQPNLSAIYVLSVRDYELKHACGGGGGVRMEVTVYVYV